MLGNWSPCLHLNPWAFSLQSVVFCPWSRWLRGISTQVCVRAGASPPYKRFPNGCCCDTRVSYTFILQVRPCGQNLAQFWCQWEITPLSVQRNNTSLVSGTMRIKSPVWIDLNCDSSYLDVNWNNPFSAEFRAPTSSIGPSLWTVFMDIGCNFLYCLTVGMWRNVAGSLLGSCQFSPTKVPSTAFQAALCM